jgi:PhnB protein
MAVKPVPDGYHTVTPYLVVPDVRKLLDFVTKAFDAEVNFQMPHPRGGVAHAEFRIGNSMIMCGMSNEQHPPLPAMLYLYVSDVDAVYAKALAAGGEEIRPVTDQFYGDRSGGLKDSNGVQWWIATHVEDVSMEEMAKRAAAHGK